MPAPITLEGLLPTYVIKQALASLKVPPAAIRRLQLPGANIRSSLSDEDARYYFLQWAATPEQRLEKARSLECTYVDLTDWTIRADLMRLAAVYLPRRPGKDKQVYFQPAPGTHRVALIGPAEAAALAAAGVLGVHDLAQRTRRDPPRPGEPGPGSERRWRDLINRLVTYPGADAIAERLEKIGCDRIHAAARAQKPMIISDVPVVLVVKGAGVQKTDETLNQFLGGFWPAAKTVEPAAAMTQRKDVFPEGYRASPHDREPHNHLTEIRAGEHAIWIKEVNWEAEVSPPDPLGSLLSEWRMGSYAFVRSISDIFQGDQQVRRAWEKYLRGIAAQPGPSQANNAPLDMRARISRARTRFYERLAGLIARQTTTTLAYTLYYLFQHVLVLLPALVVAAASVPYDWPLADNYFDLLLALFAVGCAAAIPSAVITSRRWGRYFVAGSPFPALPGLPNWVLLVLLTAILLDPVAYLAVLAVLLVMEVTLLLARAMAWRYRENVGTDTAGDFHLNPSAAADGQRWERRHHPLMKYCQYLYRHIVVLTVPFALLLFFLARLLRWTRVFELPGLWLERIISTTLSGALGDVVGYATDPAHAHRVQSVAAADIRFFLERPEVTQVHVFAHSMGTPITFETLFHHLEPRYSRNVKTYVTAGSVLSYFQQTNPVLDPVYVDRFSSRHVRRPDFATGFRWLNFWNYADPITEFYGLDEYQEYSGHDRHPYSPQDIKTRATLNNHAEYWTNRDQILEPLFRRVTGDDEPPAWSPDWDRPQPTHPAWRWLAAIFARANVPFHILYAYVWWVTLIVLAGLLGKAASLVWDYVVGYEIVQSLRFALPDSLAAVLGELNRLSPVAGSVVAWMGSVFVRTWQFAGSEAVTDLRYTVGFVALLAALLWSLAHVLISARKAWIEPQPTVADLD